jgi:hypothetical protein
MSRPKPQILLEHINKTTYVSEQVLASEGVWAILYDNKPINLRTQNILVSYPGPKYKSSSYANIGHAINHCKKLNALYKTDKFTVVKFSESIIVYP